MADHLPRRPEWTCRECGDEWPCVHAMHDLEKEHGGSSPSLGMYLVDKWFDATVDMPAADHNELYRRIVAWPRR